MTTLTTHEQQEIDRANKEGRQPVVFVHGLWLLASSWDNWRQLFEEKGYTTLGLAGPMIRTPSRRLNKILRSLLTSAFSKSPITTATSSASLRQSPLSSAIPLAASLRKRWPGRA